MLRDVLVKPLITEKTEKFSDEDGLYGFVVLKNANKIEIRKAIESKYNVNVTAVRTLIIPAKSRTRQTKSGVAKGVKPAFKKAYVRVQAGDVIDLYS